MERIYTEDMRRQAAGLLAAENASCVIRSGDETRIFRERGVKDLYRLLDTEPHFLRGALVADKVVGKGAAALMIAGGVAEIYAGVISTPARELLRQAGIPVACRLEVPRIANRTGTGLCPVETLCAECLTAEECLPLIREFIERQSC